MPIPDSLAVIKADLFTDKDVLVNKYGQIAADKVLRIRELYMWLMSNPHLKMRQMVEHDMDVFGISQSQAYSDMRIVNEVMPALNSASKSFHRWKASEMLLDTFQMAKVRKDTKTMERAATSYYKLHGADQDDETKIPYEDIVPPAFVPSYDPTPLGIEPIPNLREKIAELKKKYDTTDMNDVGPEIIDCEFEELFNKQDESED